MATHEADWVVGRCRSSTDTGRRGIFDGWTRATADAPPAAATPSGSVAQPTQVAEQVEEGVNLVGCR
jgi:hypothetical protein